MNSVGRWLFSIQEAHVAWTESTQDKTGYFGIEELGMRDDREPRAVRGTVADATSERPAITLDAEY